MKFRIAIGMGVLAIAALGLVLALRRHRSAEVSKHDPIRQVTDVIQLLPEAQRSAGIQTAMAEPRHLTVTVEATAYIAAFIWCCAEGIRSTRRQSAEGPASTPV